MSYFCFNYTNTFFIHTMNYFSVVLRIIFLMCMENYFFIGPRIIFRSIANLFWAYNAFDEVFWTEDLIEGTVKRLHDSYTILTLIEHDMSAQLNSSLPNLIPQVFAPYYTCWLSE